MRDDFFDFTPSHLVWVLSNHPPAVREGTNKMSLANWRTVSLPADPNRVHARKALGRFR